MSLFSRLLPGLVLACPLAFTACLSAATFDPATADPVVDPAHPPAMSTFKLRSGDADLNGLIYLAGGAGPHPVVVICHGYPGNEKNLDLAQAIRRAGYHVVWFNYRGSWGAGGSFSLPNALEDARNVVTFLNAEETRNKYRLDARRLAVVGHSFGGWVALMLGAADARVRAIVTLAAWNPVVDVARTEGDPAKRAAKIADLDEFDPGRGPLRGAGAAALYDDIARHRAEYDYFRRAAELRTRPLLIIAATRDPDQPLPAYHEPLVQALAAARAPRVEVVVLDDDHPFSAHRVDLARRITRWLPGALAP